MFWKSINRVAILPTLKFNGVIEAPVRHVIKDGRQTVVSRKVGRILTYYELNKSTLLTVCVTMNYHSVSKDLLQGFLTTLQ